MKGASPSRMSMATKTSVVPEPASYFFDTIVLSNFALSGRFDLLIDRYGPRAQITPEVLDEVSAGIVAGYRGLKQIEVAVEKGACSAASPLTIAERTIYRELLGTLGSGEASCITCAQCGGGLVATDDRAARSCCSETGRGLQRDDRHSQGVLSRRDFGTPKSRCPVAEHD